MIGVAAAAVVGVYGAAWLAQPRPVLWRLAAWMGGVACVLVASLPFMEALAEESFTGHMVQHLLVIVVGAPLLVLARPVHTLGLAGWLPTGSRLGPTGRRWAAWWHRWSTVVGPLFFVGVLFVTHLTAIYDVALDDRLVHELEHVAYLLGATLTWSAVLGVGRTGAPARIGAVFAVAVGGALLGMVLLSAPSAADPDLRGRARHGGGPHGPAVGGRADVGRWDADHRPAAAAGRVAVGGDRGAGGPAGRGLA